jgi:hypothetical protein
MPLITKPVIKFMSFRMISCVSVELKPTFQISPRSPFSVDVVNDDMSLIFILVCRIDASCCWCTMQQEGKVKLCGHPSDSNLSLCCLTRSPCCQTILFSFLHALLCVMLGFSWCFLIIWCWDSMLCWVWTLPLCLYCLGGILFLLFLWHVCPCCQIPIIKFV